MKELHYPSCVVNIFFHINSERQTVYQLIAPHSKTPSRQGINLGVNHLTVHIFPIITTALFPGTFQNSYISMSLQEIMFHSVTFRGGVKTTLCHTLLKSATQTIYQGVSLKHNAHYKIPGCKAFCSITLITHIVTTASHLTHEAQENLSDEPKEAEQETLKKTSETNCRQFLFHSRKSKLYKDINQYKRSIYKV